MSNLQLEPPSGFDHLDGDEGKQAKEFSTKLGLDFDPVGDESMVVKQVMALGADVSVIEEELHKTKLQEQELRMKIKRSIGWGEGENEESKRLGRDRQQKYEEALRDVINAMPNLQEVLSGAARLDGRISQTRHMADDVSRKVRQLDLSRSRALEALEKVQSIVDLNSCIRGAKEATANGDLSKAAGYIHGYRLKESQRKTKATKTDGETTFSVSGEIEMQSESGNGNGKLNIASTDLDEEDMSLSSLRLCEERLHDRALETLNIAVENKDDNHVMEMCDIFSKLGMGQKGISLFLDYHCMILQEQIEMEIELTDATSTSSGLRNSINDNDDAEIGNHDNMNMNGNDQVQSSYKPKSFVDLMAFLFNKVAALMQHVNNVIRSRFIGKASALTGTGSENSEEYLYQAMVLKKLHSQCDVLACRILNLFMTKRRIQERVQMLLDEQRKSRNRSPGPGSGKKRAKNSLMGSEYDDSDSVEEPLKQAVTLGMSVYDADRADAMILLDAFLDEIALMSQHTVSYDRYVSSKVTYLSDKLSSDDMTKLNLIKSASPSNISRRRADSTSAGKIIPVSSEYHNVMQELAGYYTILEEQFMRHGVWRAVSEEIIQYVEKSVGIDVTDGMTMEEISQLNHLNQLQAEGEMNLVAVSSTVMDSFYILQKCSQRALATGNNDSACATVNNVVRVIEEELLAGVMRPRIDELPSQATTLSQQGQAQLNRLMGNPNGGDKDEQSEILHSASTVLNTVALCAHYTSELQKQVDMEADEIIAADAELNSGEASLRQIRMLKSCCDTMVESRSMFQRSLEVGLSKFASSTRSSIHNQIDKTIGSSNTSFEMDEHDFQRTEAVDPYVRPLLALIASSIATMNPELSTVISLLMCDRIAEFTADALEAAYVRKRFTLYGALLLDKDVRRIVAFFSKRSPTTKDRFRRLMQLTEILGVDSLEEVYDVYDAQKSVNEKSELQSKSSGNRYKIKVVDPKEVKRVLALRVDFSQKDIQAIKL